MSNKFNREDSNAINDQLFNSDYVADISGIEADVRTYSKDLHRMPCIISGLAVTLNANNISVDISAGIAYDMVAYRVELPSGDALIEADASLGAINYICIRHKFSYDTLRAAYKTGVQWFSRKYDDYEVVVKTEAEGPPEDLQDAGYIILATTTGTGSGLTISSINRTSPDFSGSEDLSGPGQITGVILTTGAEPSLIYNDPSLPILAQMVNDDLPVRAWLMVQWTPVSDPSGIAAYEVDIVPLGNNNVELPDYLDSARVEYNQA